MEMFQCIVCQQWMESGFLDDDEVCDECNERLKYDGQPDEAQEWHDFNPYC